MRSQVLQAAPRGPEPRGGAREELGPGLPVLLEEVPEPRLAHAVPSPSGRSGAGGNAREGLRFPPAPVTHYNRAGSEDGGKRWKQTRAELYQYSSNGDQWKTICSDSSFPGKFFPKF